MNVQCSHAHAATDSECEIQWSESLPWSSLGGPHWKWIDSRTSGPETNIEKENPNEDNSWISTVCANQEYNIVFQLK